MEILTKPSSTLLLSLKVLLISTTVLSTAVLLNLAVPVITGFAFSEAPSMYKDVVSLIKRPACIYLIINCIIITIVATSRLRSKLDFPTDHVEVVKEEFFEFGYDGKVVKGGTEFEVYGDTEAKAAENDEFVISKSSEIIGDFTEKPPVSKRFGHRRAFKASPEGGKTLRVSRPRKQETLENTWKTITEGRPIPLTRHLKKSDTWKTPDRHSNVGHTQEDQKMMKSETINYDGNTSTNNNNSSLNQSPGGSGKLRKDPSLSQDELNRRVEAFINKFNEEMRLQRQESLNKYKEMIIHGV